MSERRLAVVDLGSNSFRLVVFSWVPLYFLLYISPRLM